MSTTTNSSDSATTAGNLPETPGADLASEREQLESDLAGDATVVFTALWCAPWQLLAPQLDGARRAGRSPSRVVTVDIDDHPGLAERFAVQVIPTVVVLRGGQETARRTGAISAAELADL